jgi:DNA-directed RNA polymerase specialized sigma24 family protein
MDGFAVERHAVSAEGLAPRGNLHGHSQSILEGLPEAQIVVFVLVKLEKLAGPEVAVNLKLSVRTVRSRLRLARVTFERRGNKGRR